LEKNKNAEYRNLGMTRTENESKVVQSEKTSLVKPLKVKRIKKFRNPIVDYDLVSIQSTNKDPKIWISCSSHVMKKILDHAEKGLNTDTSNKDGKVQERKGVLFGDHAKEKDGYRLWVKEFLPLPSKSSDCGDRCEITAEDEAKILSSQKDEMNGLEIVGLYHSHPLHHIFLSEYDIRMLNDRYIKPWHVALVVQPKEKKAGFFTRESGQFEPGETSTRIFRLPDGKSLERRMVNKYKITNELNNKVKSFPLSMKVFSTIALFFIIFPLWSITKTNPKPIPTIVPTTVLTRSVPATLAIAVPTTVHKTVTTIVQGIVTTTVPKRESRTSDKFTENVRENLIEYGEIPSFRGRLSEGDWYLRIGCFNDMKNWVKYKIYSENNEFGIRYGDIVEEMGVILYAGPFRTIGEIEKKVPRNPDDFGLDRGKYSLFRIVDTKNLEADSNVIGHFKFWEEYKYEMMIESNIEVQITVLGIPGDLVRKKINSQIAFKLSLLECEHDKLRAIKIDEEWLVQIKKLGIYPTGAKTVRNVYDGREIRVKVTIREL